MAIIIFRRLIWSFYEQSGIVTLHSSCFWFERCFSEFQIIQCFQGAVERLKTLVLYM